MTLKEETGFQWQLGSVQDGSFTETLVLIGMYELFLAEPESVYASPHALQKNNKKKRKPSKKPFIFFLLFMYYLSHQLKNLSCFQIYKRQVLIQFLEIRRG